jgi:hypothetical protein
MTLTAAPAAVTTATAAAAEATLIAGVRRPALMLAMAAAPHRRPKQAAAPARVAAAVVQPHRVVPATASSSAGWRTKCRYGLQAWRMLVAAVHATLWRMQDALRCHHWQRTCCLHVYNKLEQQGCSGTLPGPIDRHPLPPFCPTHPRTCTNLQLVQDYRRQMLPVPVRPVSAQEGTDYLQQPSFSNCTVPFLFYTTWRGNFFHVLGKSLNTCCGCSVNAGPGASRGGGNCIQPTARRCLQLLL